MTEELPSYVREEKGFNDELVKNPYEYICKIYGLKYPHLGKKIFSLISLIPISLIIPPIEISNLKSTNRTLSVLVLAPPGSGKTTISNRFSKLCLNPIVSHKITPARLIYEVKKATDSMVSLIISDISTSFSNEQFVKSVESAVEEGYVDWDTMRNKNEPVGEKRVRALAFLSGTPRLISNKRIRDGIIGRTLPIICYLNKEQHSELLHRINNGGDEDIEEEIEEIERFYKWIYEFYKNNEIKGFIIPEEIKKEMIKLVDTNQHLNEIFRRWDIPSVRYLEDSYVILACHAFLNLNSREIQDNKIVVNNEDLEVTKKLLRNSSAYSYLIYDAIERVDWYNIRSERELKEYLSQIEVKKKVPNQTKFLMGGLLKK